ncbi:MAG: hypothetical protein LBT17_02320, partial [Mycoplasmataceae bacterium]|nr:hypothetical protein [Mycoplasmataceae bacterium]
MNTSKEAKKRLNYQAKNNKRKKWPIVLSLLCASVIMAGTGIGVGYAVWHKNASGEVGRPVIQASLEKNNLKVGTGGEAVLSVTEVNVSSWKDVNVTGGNPLSVSVFTTGDGLTHSATISLNE